jgi:hypothetical protein
VKVKFDDVQRSRIDPERQTRVIFDRGEASNKPRHVGCTSESGSKIRAFASAAMGFVS